MFLFCAESNDNDFAVTAEMMVDGEDYENTLDEEEEMDDEDGDDELADLQKVLVKKVRYNLCLGVRAKI